MCFHELSDEQLHKLLFAFHSPVMCGVLHKRKWFAWSRWSGCWTDRFVRAAFVSSGMVDKEIPVCGWPKTNHCLQCVGLCEHDTTVSAM